MKESAPQENPLEAKDSFVLPELLPEEQPEEYVVRVTHLIEKNHSSIRLVKGLNSQCGNGDVCMSALSKALGRCLPAKFSNEKNKLVLQAVSDGIVFASNEAKHNDKGELGYEHTNRERWLYGDASKTDNIPYSQLLFGVYCSPEIGQGSAVPYFKNLLDDKNILLLGGGDSVKDLIAGVYGDPSLDPVPKKIINTDVSFSGIQEEQMISDMIADGTYVRALAQAQDAEQISGVLETAGVSGGADEIWASYSVPYYLKTPEEI
ncbi:MAG: hypothetical protein FGM57_03890 [Candidatus Taylorbacteria bacterium]|nr:hypothetical protein [Candidatus Taylorbacteria bacterium]